MFPDESLQVRFDSGFSYKIKSFKHDVEQDILNGINRNFRIVDTLHFLIAQIGFDWQKPVLMLNDLHLDA